MHQQMDQPPFVKLLARYWMDSSLTDVTDHLMFPRTQKRTLKETLCNAEKAMPISQAP